MALSKGERNLNYRKKSNSWFVVSGTDSSGLEFYEKFVTRGSQVAAFSRTFPESRLEQFEPWGEEIEDESKIESSRQAPALASRAAPLPELVARPTITPTHRIVPVQAASLTSPTNELECP